MSQLRPQPQPKLVCRAVRAVSSPLLSSLVSSPAHPASNALPLLPSHMTCAAPRRAATLGLVTGAPPRPRTSLHAVVAPLPPLRRLESAGRTMAAGSCAAAPVAGLPSLRTPPPTNLRIGGFFHCSSAARSPGGAVLGWTLGAKKQAPTPPAVARLNRVLASCG